MGIQRSSHLDRSAPLGRSSFAFVLPILVLLAGQARAIPFLQALNISTGNGVPGGKFTISSDGTGGFYQGETDDNGVMDISPIPGWYDVFITHPCYQTFDQLVQITGPVVFQMTHSGSPPPPSPTPQDGGVPGPNVAGCPNPPVDIGAWAGWGERNDTQMFQTAGEAGIRNFILYWWREDWNPPADMYAMIANGQSNISSTGVSCPVKSWPSLLDEPTTRYEGCRYVGYSPCECEARVWDFDAYTAGQGALWVEDESTLYEHYRRINGVKANAAANGGVRGWYLADEPHWTSSSRPRPWSPGLLREVTDWIRYRTGDRRPMFIAVAGAGTFESDYKDATDGVLSAGAYPKDKNEEFCTRNVDPAKQCSNAWRPSGDTYGFEKNVATAQAVLGAGGAAKKYMHVQMQGPASPYGMFTPTFNEQLWQLLNPVLQGIDGIYWWWYPNSTLEDLSTDRLGNWIDLWTATRMAVLELGAFRVWDILDAPSGASLIHSGGNSLTYQTHLFEGAQHIVLTNGPDADRTVQFRLQVPAAGRYVFEMRFMRKIPVTQGTGEVIFSDFLKKGATMVYRVDPIPAQSCSGVVGTRGEAGAPLGAAVLLTPVLLAVSILKFRRGRPRRILGGDDPAFSDGSALTAIDLPERSGAILVRP